MRRNGARGDEIVEILPSSLLRGLGGDELQRLRPLLEPVMVAQGALLATAGDVSDTLWFPNGAIVSAVVRLGDGEAVEAGLIGAEGLVGVDVFLGSPAALQTMIVQVPGNAFRVRVEALGPVPNEFAGLRREALRFAGVLLASTAQVAACNATHTLRQRMSRWLLMAHDRAGRDRFRLTHEFIAAMINVRRAGVSQFASQMREAGAIAYTRGEVTVTDRAVLEAESCECYAVIRRLVTQTSLDMVQ